jgi:hypothetical protein
MMPVTQIPLQPMVVVRNGKRITAIPEVNDLTLQCCKQSPRLLSVGCSAMRF